MKLKTSHLRHGRIFEYMLIFVFLTVVSWMYAFISVRSHEQLMTFGWDLGFFDQIIWKVSQGDFTAYSTLAHENLLADHFQLVLYPLALLYRIYSDVRMILIAQSFMVVYAAFPLYFLAKKVTNNIFFSFSLVISYTLFIGTQWTILNEFHQMAFVPLFLSMIYLALELKKPLLYWMCVVGLLVTKEELGLLVFSIGIVVWWFYKKRRLGMITSIIGISTFFLLIYIFMPAISVAGTYSHFDFGSAGYTPLDVIQKIFIQPFYFIQSFYIPSIKVKTVIDTFFAFGFLQLFSPIHLLPILDNFAYRFIYAGPQFTKWANVNHHAAPLGILSIIASLYGSSYIIYLSSKYTRVSVRVVYIFLGTYLMFMSVLQHITLHGPLNSLFKPHFYFTDPVIVDSIRSFSLVPSEHSVATQNNLFPHFSQRNNIYLLPEVYNAEYIVVDFHNRPNSFSPLSEAQLRSCVETLQEYSYKIIYSKKTFFILKKDPIGSKKLDVCI